MKKKLSVVVVSYNSLDYLPDLLDSLRRSTGDIDSEIVVVDNNSHDDSSSFIKKNYPKVKLHVNKKNLGFARACNKGIKDSKGNYVLIANPDIIFKNRSIKKMINFLEERPKVACCVPKLVFPDGQLQFSCRRFPSLWTALIRRTPLRLFLPSSVNDRHLMKDWDHSGIKQIDWALGACFLTKRSVFKKAGLFDEGFFVYCEDIDWFYRLRKLGLKTYYLPSTKVIHHHVARSDRRLFCKESFYHLRSVFYFFNKYRKDFFKNKGRLI